MTSTPDARAKPTAAPSRPQRPWPAVCAKPAAGPAKAPAGAVTVDPAVVGDLAAKTKSSPPNTTFWLRPGKHTLEPDRYAQVIPKEGNRYLGAPGAVLDGRKKNQYAFGGNARNVTIRYLTVQGFVAPHDEGVVNHDSADGWVIEHATIQNNSGAGLMAGARQQVRANCLRDNGQYGMNAYKAGDAHHAAWWSRATRSRATTPTTGSGGGRAAAAPAASSSGPSTAPTYAATGCTTTAEPGCGRTPTTTTSASRTTCIEANDGAALIYETSYNAVIRNNTIRRNNWVEGRKYADRGDNFPFATIYLSESGGEPRVRARTDKIEIYGNMLENNWSGITLWENADRFCNSPANTSSGDCTLLVRNTDRCAQPAIATAPLYADCRWKTQRVDIHDNRFVLDTSVVELHGEVRPHGGAVQLRHLSGLVAVQGRAGGRGDHPQAAQPLARQRLRRTMEVRRPRPEPGARLRAVAGQRRTSRTRAAPSAHGPVVEMGGDLTTR